MNYNKHFELRGKHAFLSPSQNAWLRYDDEKLAQRYFSSSVSALGTEIHEYAEIQISLGQKVTAIKNLINGIKTNIFAKYSHPYYDKETKQVLSDGSEKIGRLYAALSRIPSSSLETVKAYINDAIGFGLTPEQILYYSDVCFGTADAIKFENGVLRIHDLKTGTGVVHIEQLEIYAALFLLEYGHTAEMEMRRKIPDWSIKDILCELRIYQNDEVLVHNPDYTELSEFMDAIVNGSKILLDIKKEEAF